MISLTNEDREALKKERSNHEPVTVKRSTIAFFKLIIDLQEGQIKALEHHNAHLFKAIDKLGTPRNVTHKRVPRKNPFRVLKGGKSC
jgi:hypothetical protein